MIVHTSLVPDDILRWEDDYFDVAIVIDVLRATTTILFAISAGAKRIIPVRTVADAFLLAQNLAAEKPLLCGERNGKKLPGFHLGNSPSEYTPHIVQGHTIIYASTNGSVAMKLVEQVSRRTILASIRNLSAVVRFIMDMEPRNLLLACAGKEGRTSMEDAYCAGLLFERIASSCGAVPADDSTNIARLIYERFGDDVSQALRSSVHGRYLSEELGLWDDLTAASEIDADEIIPELKNGEIGM